MNYALKNEKLLRFSFFISYKPTKSGERSIYGSPNAYDKSYYRAMNFSYFLRKHYKRLDKN
jgi:hypothetical protein